MSNPEILSQEVVDRLKAQTDSIRREEAKDHLPNGASPVADEWSKLVPTPPTGKV